MSTGLYSHTTRGTGTILTAVIYNGDHVNHITNQNPEMTGAYSDSVGEFQTTFDPGGVGSENLPQNLADELGALRFAIQALAGGAQWYDVPGSPIGPGDVVGPASAVDQHFPVFDGTSGKLLEDAGYVLAVVADVRAATAFKMLDAALLETAAASVALVDAATVAVDWDTFINATLTIAANRIIGNPTNGQPGTYRTIFVQGNDATDRTLTFGNQFLGTLPTLTDIDSGKKYMLTIRCVTASHFLVVSNVAAP